MNRRLPIMFLFMALVLTQWPGFVSALETGAIISEGRTRLLSPNLLENLTKITASDDFNFGIRPDGTVVSWGEDGLYLNEIIDPTAQYLDVSLGYLHVMLLNTDGSITAYSGPDTWFTLTPPAPNSGFSAISAGNMLSLALRDDGSVVSWGVGAFTVPEPNAGFTAIAAGAGTGYGLHADGSISVWGSNTYGQYDVPQPNSGFVALSAGDHFAMALRDDGSIAIWGRDNCGQLNLPFPNSNFTAMTAGACHALALRDGGIVEAWGDNSQGQAQQPSSNSGFTYLAAGIYHSVAVRDNGELVAWGRREDGACGVYPPNENFIAVDSDLAIRSDGSLWLHFLGRAPADVPTPNSGFVHIEQRSNFTLALRDDGSIEGWGQNYDGQLDVPLPNSGYATFSTGNNFSIGLRDDGTIETWGDNWHGQMDIPEPDAQYIAVAAGSHHCAAVKSDGSVSVWGYVTAAPPGSETGYVAIEAGLYHTLALHEDGHLEVWSAWAGALAIPDPNSGFVAIHADDRISVAMREDGTVGGWGQSGWSADQLFSDSSGVSHFEVFSSNVFAIETQAVSSVGDGVPVAGESMILEAAPNPFNPSLTIWFESQRDEAASIGVYDLKGRRIRTLWTGQLVAQQRRSVQWDGRDDFGARAASGTYLVNLSGRSGVVETRGVSLVK